MVDFNPALPDQANLGDEGHITDHNTIVAALRALNSGKPDSTQTDAALALKADKSVVDTHLAATTNVHGIPDTAQLATKTELSAGLVLKADKTQVATDLATKADKTQVDALTTTVTANKTAADTALAGKANSADVTAGLALKADKASIGNLLTANQATGTDALATADGFYGGTGTNVPTSSTAWAAQGSRCAEWTTTGTGNAYCNVGANNVGAVTNAVAGEVYTFTAEVSASAAESCRLEVWAYPTAALAAYGPIVTVPASPSSVTLSLTVVVPAGKTALQGTLKRDTGAAGTALRMDKVSLHRGAAGQWQPPGVPIPNQSVLPVTQTPVPQAKLWAGQGWAPQPVIIGSGSPLGIVVPDFKGQEFVDTQQTLGARKWVATGTTASSWVVNDGDTGWLPVTTWTAAGVVSGTALPSGWQPFPDYAGGFWLRRRQEGVTAHITNLQAASINPAFLVLPTGWRASNSNNFALPMIPGTGAPVVRTWQVASGSLGRGSNATISASDFVAYSVLPLWPTSDPWPTAAPV